MNRLLIAAILIGCFCGTASGNGRDAKYYREICQQSLVSDGEHRTTENLSSEEWLHAGLCMGYAAGFMEAVDGKKIDGPDGKIYTISFVDGVSVGQLVKVVCAYIDKHPEILHWPIRSVFWNAVETAELMDHTPVDKPVVRAKQ